jgi:hypothetical protein
MVSMLIRQIFFFNRTLLFYGSLPFLTKPIAPSITHDVVRELIKPEHMRTGHGLWAAVEAMADDANGFHADLSLALFILIYWLGSQGSHGSFFAW